MKRDKDRIVNRLISSIEKKGGELSDTKLQVVKEHLNYAFVAGFEYLRYDDVITSHPGDCAKRIPIVQFCRGEIIGVYSSITKAVQISKFGKYHIYLSLQKGITYDGMYFVYLSQLRR